MHTFWTDDNGSTRLHITADEIITSSVLSECSICNNRQRQLKYIQT